MYPRFVECDNFGYPILKSFKLIKGPLFDDKDKFWLKNVLMGNIVTNQLYPLIFDDPNMKNVGSFTKMKELINDPNLYLELSEEEKHMLKITVRDGFIANQLKLLTEDEVQLFRKVTDIITDDQDDNLNISGLNFSYHPSRSRKLLRFVPLHISGLDAIYNVNFIVDKNNFLMTFIDPHELSYHNFENIFPMDLHLNLSIDKPDTFSIVGEDVTEKTSRLSSVDSNNKNSFEQLIIPHSLTNNNQNNIIKTTLPDNLTSELLKLNNMDIYEIPLNSKSRGGQRFIFTSQKLATYLGNYLIENNIFEKSSGFVSVNNVFRYNKFTPGERKFYSHYDTPYVDNLKKEYSRYTMLLYLTTGCNSEGVIKFS